MRNYKYYMLIAIIINTILQFQLFSQQVGSWEELSTFQHYSYNNVIKDRGNVTDRIAISNGSNIVAICQDTIGLNGTDRTSQPTIIMSSDGGSNWTTIRKDTNDNKNDFICISYPTDNVIVIAGDTANITIDIHLNYTTKSTAFLLISKDKGISWNKKFLDSNSTISNITMVDNNIGALIKWTLNDVNVPDSILITNDCWETWQSIVAPNNLNMNTYQIVMNDLLNIMIYGLNKDDHKCHVWITSDGGLNWQISQNLPLSISAGFRLRYTNSQTAWLLGGITEGLFYTHIIVHSVLLKSTDGGFNWIEKKFDSEDSLDAFTDINFINDNVGILVGKNGKIFSTTDGGNTWKHDYMKFLVPVVIHNFDEIIHNKDLSIIFENGNVQNGNNYLFNCINKKSLEAPYIYPYSMQYPFKTLIKWKKVDNALKYRFQIGVLKKTSDLYFDTTLFNNPVVDTLLTETNIELHNLQYNKYYYAKAQALNDSEESDWYVCPYAFRTSEYEEQLLPLEIFYPKNAELNVPIIPTFIWEKIDGATSYNIQLQEGFGFSSKIFDKTLKSDTSITLPFSLLSDSIYYVYISYFKGDSASAYAINGFKTTSVTSVPDNKFGISENNISTFPNPFNDILNIQFENGLTSDYIELYDILGILRKSIKLENRDKCRIEASDLTPGIYFIKTDSGINEKVYKVVKLY